MTASYHELTFAALDRLSVGADRIVTGISECAVMKGVVVLATCNRFELYLDVDAPLSGQGLSHAAREAAGLVASTSGVDDETALASFRIRTGAQAVKHLFTVACGLDSMVVGEREIAGQVKRALAVSHAAHACSPLLEMLFQRAARTSKSVARQTGLGGIGRSVVTHSLDLAEKSLPKWGDVKALLVGTGSYAGAVLAALHGRGCSGVRVYSPSGRATAFAASHDALPVNDLRAALADVDIVLSCSGTRTAQMSDRGYVIDAAMLDNARPLQAADGRRLVLIDLALHNDIDPDVAGLDSVSLFDLAGLTAEAPDADADAVRTAHRIIADAVADFEQARLGREADAAVVALREQAEEKIAAEVAKLAGLARQLGHAVDIDALTSRVRGPIHAQLHQHILRAKAEAIATAKAEERLAVSQAASPNGRTE